jgi:hypothetical protein
MLHSFQSWLPYGTREFLSMSKQTIPVMYLIIKKRAGIHFLQVQYAEHIQFWAVPNMLEVHVRVLATPNPGFVSIQFSTCMKLTFITKTYRLQESFSLYFSAFFPHGTTAPTWPRPTHYRGFTITLRHTTLGRTPLDERSSRRRDLYLTIHNTH